MKKSELSTIEQSCIRDAMKIGIELQKCIGIKVELVGEWLWIDGNTQMHEAYLRALGCKKSKSKNKWYWRSNLLRYRESRQTKTTYKEITDKYGIQAIQQQEEE